MCVNLVGFYRRGSGGPPVSQRCPTCHLRDLLTGNQNVLLTGNPRVLLTGNPKVLLRDILLQDLLMDSHRRPSQDLLAGLMEPRTCCPKRLEWASQSPARSYLSLLQIATILGLTML